MCSFPFTYIAVTVNAISSPVTTDRKFGGYKMSHHLLRTPLLVITSALSVEVVSLDPRHAAITGARDGQSTWSKRVDVT